MSRDAPDVRDDATFLRALAQGGAEGSAKDGAILMAVGLIFSLVALEYWLIEAGVVRVSETMRSWLWLDGLVPFILALGLISRKFQGQTPGAASRGLSAAWAGVGAAHVVSAVALILAGRRLGLPLLTPWVFPLVLFTLFGVAWSVAFAVRRRRSFAVSAAGSYVAVMLCAMVIGRPEEWLVLAIGLFGLVAAPGAGILHAARRPV
jgi:hypothetical protein